MLALCILLLYIHLSITSGCSTETAKCRITYTICYTIAQRLQFSDAKGLCEIRTGLPQREHQMQVE